MTYTSSIAGFMALAKIKLVEATNYDFQTAYNAHIETCRGTVYTTVSLESLMMEYEEEMAPLRQPGNRARLQGSLNLLLHMKEPWGPTCENYFCDYQHLLDTKEGIIPKLKIPASIDPTRRSADKLIKRRGRDCKRVLPYLLEEMRVLKNAVTDTRSKTDILAKKWMSELAILTRGNTVVSTPSTGPSVDYAQERAMIYTHWQNCEALLRFMETRFPALLQSLDDSICVFFLSSAVHKLERDEIVDGGCFMMKDLPFISWDKQDTARFQDSVKFGHHPAFMSEPRLSKHWINDTSTVQGYANKALAWADSHNIRSRTDGSITTTAGPSGSGVVAAAAVHDPDFRPVRRPSGPPQLSPTIWKTFVFLFWPWFLWLM